MIQVESMYRSTFFNFIAYMIFQISKSHNLDILFKNKCDKATLKLFLKLLDAFPIPKLAEIKVRCDSMKSELLLHYYTLISQAYNNTWDCRVHTVGRTGYSPQFPFFMKVSTQICNMIEESMAEINKTVNILQEKESSRVFGSFGMTKNNYMIFYKVYDQIC